MGKPVPMFPNQAPGKKQESHNTTTKTKAASSNSPPRVVDRSPSDPALNARLRDQYRPVEKKIHELALIHCAQGAVCLGLSAIAGFYCYQDLARQSTKQLATIGLCGAGVGVVVAIILFAIANGIRSFRPWAIKPSYWIVFLTFGFFFGRSYRALLGSNECAQVFSPWYAEVVASTR